MSGLDPRILLRGYAAGIFPMADSRDADEIFWVEPRERARDAKREVVCKFCVPLL